MWNWLAANKQWVFSGVGVTVLAVGWWLLKKLLSPRTQTINSVTQAPVVNISPTFNLPQPSPAVALAPSATSSRVPIEGDEDRRPKLYSLPPRICSITVKNGDGFTEGDDSFNARAVVATFRMARPSADGHKTHITERLSYRTTTDIGCRDISEELHRVNYGAWIDEDFNFAEMALTDTKELILVVQESGKCVAVQDNRHSVSKCNPPSFHELVAGVDAFYVDVTLVDDRHGALTLYTYKIETSPLRVHEIIRVPPAGS